jgi:hypothetical protein
MADVNSIFKRYWIYSKTEATQLKSVTKTMSSNDFKLGTVVTEGGIAKAYTSIIRDKSKIAYPDSVIVREGDIRKVHYTRHLL